MINFDIFTDEKDVKPPAYYKELADRGEYDKLLDPPPEKAALAIWEKIQSSDEAQAFVIHAKTMFAGKTKAACMVAELADLKDVSTLAFQPGGAKRYEAQESSVVTNDGIQLPALTTDNDLHSVLKYLTDIEHDFSNKTKPVVLIDELMFYGGNEKRMSAEEIAEIIESIRKKGFNVMVTGITKTFQNEPFFYMEDIANASTQTPHWHSVEMSTKCVHCGNKAEVTRRYVIKNGQKEIARHDEPYLAAGGADLYEPVCGTEHPSCIFD